MYQPQPIYHNLSAKSWTSSPATSTSPAAAYNFHASLPSFTPTPLLPLRSSLFPTPVPHITPSVYLKSETSRLSLPSFKILGASYACFRALCALFSLPLTPLPTIATLSDLAQEKRVCFVAATDGNHGRAVARMARIFGVGARIFVPWDLDDEAVGRIEKEGEGERMGRVEVRRVEGSYDDAIAEAEREARRGEGRVLVQDMAVEGHEELEWILEGYTTLLHEIDAQLAAQSHPCSCTHVFVPVGVGSLAQAVTTYLKSPLRQSPVSIIAIEPSRAACLYASLLAGSSTPIETSHTIMTGMNCGTVSSAAWPVLRDGIDACVTVGEWEVHKAVEELEGMGVMAGPCGAAGLAGLKRVLRSEEARERLGMNKESAVVLICSEGKRGYDVPGMDE